MTANTPRSSARYKLYYFNFGGRAEAIRLVFKASGVPFTDVRLTSDQWAQLKPETPYGGLPVLEMEGRMFGESSAILRWAARKFGLSGKTDCDELVVEACVQQGIDLREELYAWYYEKDEARKTERLTDLMKNIHTFMSRWEAIAKDTKSSARTYTYIVGTSLTVADLVLFDLMEQLNMLPDLNLEKYTKLKNNKVTVAGLHPIKEYLSTRPSSAS